VPRHTRLAFRRSSIPLGSLQRPRPHSARQPGATRHCLRHSTLPPRSRVSARNYLRQRGVPYTEVTVSTREDFAALQRLSGAGNLPFMTVGAQHVPGFSEAEWSQYFDAAGYPKTSQLPPTYRNAAARPLVVVQQAAPAPQRAAAPQQPQSADATPTPGPAADNPAGIRF
jgi:hypothetical protein